MKSATSSVHHILADHEDIFIPDPELHFFCMDDVVQHPDFHTEEGREVDYKSDFRQNLEWYRSFFEEAESSQLIGEDSTVYLASPKAPSRVKELLPEVKLVFMLRNPIDRTYSHYWHRVRSGRAVHKFEQELEYGTSTLYLRSFYKRQLDRYFRLFSRDQVKVILFERFVENTQDVVEDLCSFLGLSRSVDVSKVERHVNASSVPRSHRLQLAVNYAVQELDFWERYAAHLPGKEKDKTLSAFDRLLRGVLLRIQQHNLQEGNYPPMASATREKLGALYARENRGLDTLLGRDLGRWWPFWTQHAR